jgi:hypothetical protein
MHCSSSFLPSFLHHSFLRYHLTQTITLADRHAFVEEMHSFLLAQREVQQQKGEKGEMFTKKREAATVARRRHASSSSCSDHGHGPGEVEGGADADGETLSLREALVALYTVAKPSMVSTLVFVCVCVSFRTHVYNCVRVCFRVLIYMCVMSVCSSAIM